MTVLPTRPVLTVNRPARPTLLARLHALLRAALHPDAQATHDRQQVRAALNAEAHRAALLRAQLTGTPSGGRV
ncbi:hypothetical protein [Deinococcus knuensis]|uniref:Uncharacterized protein n=1 Tax=Deinococcus knuensis TaxID=1837380 RepID=A0ABQ2SYA5_9DEIO|nr:hypothetical protein [Deinococcus knuensis]GGS43939.1 hypothetical protein GCM10008961_38620 [Deinococcus knuensis]